MRISPAFLFPFLLAAPALAQEPSSSPTPPPPPPIQPSGPGESWYPVGRTPPPPGEGFVNPWDQRDPNEDDIFFFPTGRTLRRGELTLGFPGPGGAPDIQYGVTDWLQVGAGYSLFGFTPMARLGLIRGRRVDLTLVGGAYLPVGTTHPFTAQFVGGVLSAGRDEFRVHLGYQFVQIWGDPFPDVTSVDGGLGMTGVEVKVAPRAKMLFDVVNYAQTNAPSGTAPFYAFAVTPGVRVYSHTLSADLGLAIGEAYNLKLSRTEPVKNATFVLPLVTLRYQL